MAEKRIYVDLDAKEDVSIGTGTAAATYPSRLHIKGSGTTSGTTSLTATDSGGTPRLQVFDDGVTHIENRAIISPSSLLATGQVVLSNTGVLAIDSIDSPVGVSAANLNTGSNAKAVVKVLANVGGGIGSIGLAVYNSNYDTGGVEVYGSTFKADKGELTMSDGVSSLLISYGSNNTETLHFINNGQSHIVIDSATKGSIGVGLDQTGVTLPSARLHVKGIGATSGTSSFLVENSAGVDALVVKDNLNVYANGSGGILSNTAFGSNASITNLTGARNTAFGESALRVNTRSENTAFGWETLKANTTGSRNTAVGRSSMSLNSLGSSNTAVGYTALNRTTGSFNTAIGSDSLARLLTASFNTAVGYKSAFLTTTGANNTVIGYTALQNNVIGSDNTLVGKGAMGSNVDGNNNTGVGVDAMHDALTGDGNTVIGYNGMYSIIDGSNNTSVGDTAARENISGTRNISLGYNSGRYNLVSNTLYIHNGLGVTTTIDEKTNSIIYGVMDAVANNQRLTFNSSVGIGVVASTTAKLHVAGNATDGTAALRVEDSAGLSSITIQNNGVVVLREFTVATLPTQVSGGIIIVTDETGGHTMATSDGTNWRRVSDGQIVS